MTASQSALGHREHHAVAQDPGVVDDDVEPAVGVERLLDEALGTGHVADVVTVDDRLATQVADDLGYLMGRTGIGAGAVRIGAEIVDHDLGAVLGEHQGVLSTDAAAGAGNHCDAPFVQLAHQPSGTGMT